MDESDDEQIVAVMSDDNFAKSITDLIKSIISGDYTMDAALFNVQ